MSNPAARAIMVALKAQQRLMGLPITYRTGNVSLELTAVPTSPQSQLVDENGQLITHTTHRDWLVLTSELADDNQPIEPENGHEIEWTDTEGVLHYFSVTPLNGTEVWRWMDAFHVGRRIHSFLERTE